MAESHPKLKPNDRWVASLWTPFPAHQYSLQVLDPRLQRRRRCHPDFPLENCGTVGAGGGGVPGLGGQGEENCFIVEQTVELGGD